MPTDFYKKLIEDSEREIEVIKLRIAFWQREEASAKGSKDYIVQQLGANSANLVIQQKWLDFVKEKSRTFIEKVSDVIKPQKK